MIKVNTKPSPIHTIYNPVIFKLRGKQNSKETISLLSKKNIIYITINFNNNGRATIDISEPLKSFFEALQKPNEENTITTNNYQSIQYKLYEGKIEKENINKYPLLSTHTAVQASIQIQESLDLTIQRGKLLTAFNKLIVYDEYKRDVSYLAVEESYANFSFTPDRIYQIPLSCKDNGKDIELPSYYHCTLEWLDEGSICQIKPNQFIPIYTPTEFIQLNEFDNPNNLPYLVMNDLYMENDQVNINNFQGKLLGQNFEIKNINGNIFKNFAGSIHDLGFNLNGDSVIINNDFTQGELINIKVTNNTMPNSVVQVGRNTNLKYCTIDLNIKRPFENQHHFPIHGNNFGNVLESCNATDCRLYYNLDTNEYSDNINTIHLHNKCNFKRVIESVNDIQRESKEIYIHLYENDYNFTNSHIRYYGIKHHQTEIIFEAHLNLDELQAINNEKKIIFEWSVEILKHFGDINQLGGVNAHGHVCFSNSKTNENKYSQILPHHVNFDLYNSLIITY